MEMTIKKSIIIIIGVVMNYYYYWIIIIAFMTFDVLFQRMPFQTLLKVKVILFVTYSIIQDIISSEM